MSDDDCLLISRLALLGFELGIFASYYLQCYWLLGLLLSLHLHMQKINSEMIIPTTTKPTKIYKANELSFYILSVGASLFLPIMISLLLKSYDVT